MAESIRLRAAATFFGKREWRPEGRRWLEDALWARVQVRLLAPPCELAGQLNVHSCVSLSRRWRVNLSNFPLCHNAVMCTASRAKCWCWRPV